LMAIAIPTILWGVWRRNSPAAEGRRPSTAFSDWWHGRVETWQGPVEGWDAAIEVLLPLGVAALGMTAIGVIFRLTAGGGEQFAPRQREQGRNREEAMFKWRRETTLDIYNIILGVALFAAPWLFSYTQQAARADDWVTGAIIIAFAVGAVVAFAEWEEWISMLLGIWVLVSPWLLGFAHSRAMPIHVAIGLVIMFLSGLENMKIGRAHV